jgi:EmrB/QacA subfamily drug resistance transporter
MTRRTTTKSAIGDQRRRRSLTAPLGSGQSQPRRWWALAVLVSAQLMIMLDVTIVNIALPSAQRDLGLNPASRQWVLTAYALAFGGLLLLGGRIADYLGRRRTFICALLGFAAASALGGLAWAPWPLFAARALQGAFGAAMAPALLSFISVIFPEGRDRARAFGVYSAVSAAGGAVGLLLGGALTEYLSWRWCLLVNTPLALVTAIAGARLLRESKATGEPGYDVAGAILVTMGLFSIVYAASRAADEGWGSAGTLMCHGAGALLLAGFLSVEWRSANPLLPLQILADRARMGAFLSCLFSFGANMGMILIVVVYLQGTLGEPALNCGVAFLPFMAGAGISSLVASQLVTRLAPRVVMTAGFAFATIGVASLTSIGTESAYAAEVLPGLLLDGFGVGLIFVTANSLALFGVADRDSGVASGALNATQQVGGAVGVALVNTVAVSAAAAFLAHGGGRTGPQAAVHGYTHGLAVAAGLMAAGGILAAALVKADRHAISAPSAGMHM